MRWKVQMRFGRQEFEAGWFRARRDGIEQGRHPVNHLNRGSGGFEHIAYSENDYVL
jgi:hypothetical protein